MPARRAELATHQNLGSQLEALLYENYRVPRRRPRLEQLGEQQRIHFFAATPQLR